MRPIKLREEDFEDLGLCPCGGQIGANSKTCAVTHSVPPCQAFIRLDPIAFMKYVRQSRGIADN